MSDIGKGVWTYLQTKSGVTDLVGTRIYPDVAPQNPTLPLVLMEITSGDSADHLGGGVGNATERISFDCYATTRSAVNALAEALRVALHGYKGPAGSETIQGCLMVLKIDLTDQPIDGDSYSVRYRKVIDFEVVHTEATTTT